MRFCAKVTYLRLLFQENGFCLLIKPKTYARPDVISNPMAFGIHGFHDGDQTLYVDKLMLPAFNQFRKHIGFRRTPVTAQTLEYAESYANICMEQLLSSGHLLMLENLSNAAPEKLVASLCGSHVGPVDPSVC